MFLYSVWESEKSMCNHIHTFFGRRHWGQTWNWDDPLCTERGGIQIIFVFVSPLLKGSWFKICIVRYRGDSFSINPISVTEEAFGGENFVWFDWVDVNTCGFTSLHSCCCMSGLVNHPLCKNTFLCLLTTERANVSNQSMISADFSWSVFEGLPFISTALPSVLLPHNAVTWPTLTPRGRSRVHCVLDSHPTDGE